MITESRTDHKDHVRPRIFDPTHHEDWTEVTELRSANYVLTVDVDSKVSDLVEADHSDGQLHSADPNRESDSDRANISVTRLVRACRKKQIEINVFASVMTLNTLRTRISYSR